MCTTLYECVMLHSRNCSSSSPSSHASSCLWWMGGPVFTRAAWSWLVRHSHMTALHVSMFIKVCIYASSMPADHSPTGPHPPWHVCVCVCVCACVCACVCVCVCEDIVHLINTPRGSAQEPALRWLFHSLPQAAEARLWRSCRPSFSPTVSYSQSIRSWMHVWALHACWRWQCRHGNQLYLIYTSDQLMM